VKCSECGYEKKQGDQVTMRFCAKIDASATCSFHCHKRAHQRAGLGPSNILAELPSNEILTYECQAAAGLYNARVPPVSLKRTE